MSDLSAELQLAIDEAIRRQLDERLGGLEGRLDALAGQLERLEGRLPEERVSILVFSGEMDNLMVAFILATGAAAMGLEVTMYFTFWGLNALRRKRVFADKTVPERILAAMLPSSPTELPTSRLNMLGLGPVFFRKIMADHHVEKLPDLIELAGELEVEMVACEMSMGLLGLRREELVDGLTYGGVASYIDTVADAKVTLFI